MIRVSAASPSRSHGPRAFLYPTSFLLLNGVNAGTISQVVSVREMASSMNILKSFGWACRQRHPKSGVGIGLGCTQVISHEVAAGLSPGSADRAPASVGAAPGCTPSYTPSRAPELAAPPPIRVPAGLSLSTTPGPFRPRQFLYRASGPIRCREFEGIAVADWR